MWHLVKILFTASMAVISCKSEDQRMAALAGGQKSMVSGTGPDGALVIGDTELSENRNILAGMPKLTMGHKFTEKNIILSREQFVLSFDIGTKIPLWTSWQILPDDLGKADRTNEFRQDDLLNNYLEAKLRASGPNPDDYRNSCFDRGHQAPSADRTRSMSDNIATFYMSNMAPQTAFLNRAPWKNLEKYCRSLVINDHRKLQVFAGVILRDGREGIGPNKDIQVPDAFYKVIIVFNSETSKRPMGYLAVIIPNVTSEGLDPLANRDVTCKEQSHEFLGKSSSNWTQYKVSLEELETRANVSFPQLKGAKSL